MEHRYSLRFETGERAGETIPVQGKGFTVGRKPGHALQILDNSVSGKHAEILVDDRGALLRDLGSTNGTRVGAERVLETRLSHGDRITFGNIQMVFLDAARAETGPLSGTSTGSDPLAATSGVAAVGPAPTADTMLRVSPEILARSRAIPHSDALRDLVALHELVWYGLRDPRAEDAARARSLAGQATL